MKFLGQDGYICMKSVLQRYNHDPDGKVSDAIPSVYTWQYALCVGIFSHSVDHLQSKTGIAEGLVT